MGRSKSRKLDLEECVEIAKNALLSFEGGLPESGFVGQVVDWLTTNAELSSSEAADAIRELRRRMFFDADHDPRDPNLTSLMPTERWAAWVDDHRLTRTKKRRP